MWSEDDSCLFELELSSAASSPRSSKAQYAPVRQPRFKLEPEPAGESPPTLAALKTVASGLFIDHDRLAFIETIGEGAGTEMVFL